METSMKAVAALTASVALFIPLLLTQTAHAQTEQQDLRQEDVLRVAPALEKYAKQQVFGDLWNRPGLSPRDRSIVTISALIAREETALMPFYFNKALDSGVKPSELSGIITHLAFYSGRANAYAAVGPAKDAFASHGVAADATAPASPDLLPINEAADAERARRVEAQFGNVAPGLVQYTTDVLFRDLWLRSDLSPRDRSLVTISALIAAGQTAQLGGHLVRAMDNGLKKEEIAETLTHLAFYVGWPNAFSAMPIAKDVFEKRAK
jgi:4-carboxymuconolactone decarboxylase